MQPYPHHYTVDARGPADGTVVVTAAALPALETAPPPEFDGPGGAWSPESLLVAAVADCFVLTFRSIARAARYDWSDLQCRVEGVLDRVGGVAQFTRFATHARLAVPAGADHAKARGLLERAEKHCLIANSLRAERSLSADVAEA
jgi:organic hydroperoxide reductase OsmC/OhrA